MIWTGSPLGVGVAHGATTEVRGVRQVGPELSGSFRPIRPNPMLTVVLPAWNEEKYIDSTLTAVTAALRAIPSVELIVVDDGSSDATAAAVQRWMDARPDCPVFLLSLARHSGKGAALRVGIIASKGETVSYIDADLDIPAEELLRLYRKTLSAAAASSASAVVVGSKRHLTWIAKGVPLPRRLISMTFSLAVRCLFSLPVRDTQTGLKLFPGPWLRSAIHNIALDGFLFDLSLLIEARKARLAIIEERVAYIPRRSENRIGLRQVSSSVRELLGLYLQSLHHRPQDHQSQIQSLAGGTFYADSDA